MRIIETDKVKPEKLPRSDKEFVYNGLDCCITYEILEALLPQLNNQTASTYAFSRALQGPVLEMRLRGVFIDQAAKEEAIEDYYNKLDLLERNLERIVREGLGVFGFNWRSTKDLQHVFYENIGIPIIKKRGRPTVDRNALERINSYFPARQIVEHLILLRELDKKISTLKTEIDNDGRMRTSINITGTSTGRFSSSSSDLGTGGNLQNIEEILRKIYVCDPGMKMAKFDAKSGESFCVGAIEWNLFKDGRYLDACETGDPHTATARLCWPKLPWTGDIKADKQIAEQDFYRHYSYRFTCKKLGHGSNYMGQPHTLAQQSKVDVEVVEDFQRVYFRSFPAHLRWHEVKKNELLESGKLTSLTGRERQFWGRRNDPATIREAMAYDPQGSLADIVNTAMLQVWRSNSVELLMHDHDALTFQYPEELEDEIIPKLFQLLRVTIPLDHDRALEIPYDCVTGWNKAKYSEKNPDGLKDYVPGDKRKRQAKVGIVD